uniref:Fibrinogen-like protein 1-like protein n=1 Tax=Petromyzon marinus TaxID=7757 RepID=A0AAJ7TKR1_PETMA|nr:fibrinogen-like protein 1-like protein [Petromyzon marinus]
MLPQLRRTRTHRHCEVSSMYRFPCAWFTLTRDCVVVVFLALHTDCHDIYMSSQQTATSGLYLIHIGTQRPLVVFCEMSKGGGWTVFQKITLNSTLDFNRTWSEYKQGFGLVNGDHWLGNEHLHMLTHKGGRYRLKVELFRDNGTELWAEYDPFRVDGEASKYKLRLGLHSGTAADALSQDSEAYLHDNQKFTTIDSDNDNYFQNCAELVYNGVSGGGWWYDACAGAILNRPNLIYWHEDCNRNNSCHSARMLLQPSEPIKHCFVSHSEKCHMYSFPLEYP